MKWLWGVLGLIGSAAALISLVQNAGQIRLIDSLDQYVEFYRSTLRQCVDWIPFPNGWRFHQWYLDSVALNGITCASAYRTIRVTYGKQPFTFGAICSVCVIVPGGALIALWIIAWFGGRWIGSASKSRDYLEKLLHWRREATARGSPDPSVYDEHIGIAQNHIAEANRLRFGPLIFIAFVGVTVAATFAFFALDALLKAQGIT